MNFGKILLAISILFSLVGCAADVVQHNNKGNGLYTEGEYEQAITEYQLAQVDAPDRAAPYFNASNAYNQKGNVDAALAQAQQSLKTADESLAAQTWYNLGNAFFNAEQWPQAIESYQESLRLRPADVDAKHNLELALKKLEQQQEQEQQEQSGETTPTPSADQSADQATPTPGSSSEEASSEPVEGMSVEQAMQLLQALSENTQTLQEKLQEMNSAPPYSSGQDW